MSAPAFSPDGKLVTFLVEREDDQKGVQIWAIPADGGEARALTSHDGSVAGYRWSPDGSRIAFAATDAESEEEKKAKEAGRDWEVAGEDPSFRHLWLYDVATKESRRAFAGARGVVRFAKARRYASGFCIRAIIARVCPIRAGVRSSRPVPGRRLSDWLE